MSGTTRTNPISMFDLTIPCDRYDLNFVLTWMRQYCKRWCFQEERGRSTNYHHFQARISLITKKRVNTMIQFIADTMPGTHVSPTTNETFTTGNEFYVMKDETRVNGPWTDRDPNPASFPKRLRDTPTWRPWQQSVIDIINRDPDDRTVNVIIDVHGNNGKSFLGMWLGVRGIAQRVPAQKETRDIMRMIMDCDKRKCYFIDLPRATSMNNQHAIYTAIEEIKNGYAYDDRYHFKEEYFEPPHVFVYTNNLPDESLLTRDRWVLWHIYNNELHLWSEREQLFKPPPQLPFAPQMLTLNVIRQ